MSMVKRAKQFSKTEKGKWKVAKNGAKTKTEIERKEKPSKRCELKWAAANVCVGVGVSVGVDCSTGKTRLHTNRRDKAGHASAQELEWAAALRATPTAGRCGRIIYAWSWSGPWRNRGRCRNIGAPYSVDSDCRCCCCCVKSVCACVWV